VAGRGRRKAGGVPSGTRPALYFEGFRNAEARLAGGLVRRGPPATAAELAAAEKALGRRLPGPYAAFLSMFDGAELFNEGLVLAGVGASAARALVELSPDASAPLVFAEGAAGDRYEFGEGDDPAVWHIRPDGERWHAGSTYPRWLDSYLAREALLYDSEGEFVLEAFEEDGQELTPTFALRQAERALRKDPDAGETHHDLALALRRLGRSESALEHFVKASDLDPQNPWTWFDRARAQLAEGAAAPATEAFRRAGETAAGVEGARFFAWAARAAEEAGLPAEAEKARQAALARDPEIRASLERAAEAAAAEDDEDATREARRLIEAFAAPKRRLPLAPR
jgi:tetratricopeptide (TPR) repeat protein